MTSGVYKRRKTATCPECGKAFSPQGLRGHRHFYHGKGLKTPRMEEIGQLIKKRKKIFENFFK